MSGNQASGGPAPGRPEEQPYGAPPVPYASWLQRVGAYAVDYLASLLACMPLFVGAGLLSAGVSTRTDRSGDVVDVSVSGLGWAGLVVTLLGVALGAGFQLWNLVYRQGRTGWSIGKGVVGIRLVRQATGRPVGPLLALGRQCAHLVDAAICYLGFLWPLWDARRQTLGDKLCGTVVIRQPRP